MVNSQFTFVSGIFDGLGRHKHFTGRLNRGKWYGLSLDALQNTGVNFRIHGTSQDLGTLSEFDMLKAEFIDTSLYELPCHSEIMRIRKIMELTHCERSHHVMYGKIEWLNEAINSGMNDDEYIFWIDAGLSHRGIFPNKCASTGISEPPDFTSFYNIDKIFTPALPISLMDATKDKLFFIECNTPEGITGIDKGYYGIEKLTYSGNIIGGLFGGRVKVVKTMIKLFRELYYKMCLDDKLYHEELLLTMIANIMHDEVEVKKFLTWYHEDTKHSINTTMKCFSEVFTDDLNMDITK